MRIFFTFALLLLAACTNVTSQGTSTLHDGAVMHSFKCDDSWDACYRAAARACGDAGYTEIDRLGGGALTSGERLDRVLRADDGIHSQDLPESMPRDTRSDGVLTIRCDTSQ